MKISVYNIKKLYPENLEQEELFCDIVNMPSLKSGYIEVKGDFSHFITKSELNKISKVFYKTYDFSNKKNIDGLLIFGNNTNKLIAIL
jgi:hypothetical protein